MRKKKDNYAANVFVSRTIYIIKRILYESPKTKKTLRAPHKCYDTNDSLVVCRGVIDRRLFFFFNRA